MTAAATSASTAVPGSISRGLRDALQVPEYPEYHTSLDDLDLVTPAGLEGGFSILRECLDLLERNKVYRTTCLGEPQLGRRGLYPTLGTRATFGIVRAMMDLLAYADGSTDLIGISDTIGVPVADLHLLAERLAEHGLLAEVTDPAVPA